MDTDVGCVAVDMLLPGGKVIVAEDVRTIPCDGMLLIGAEMPSPVGRFPAMGCPGGDVLADDAIATAS